VETKLSSVIYTTFVVFATAILERPLKGDQDERLPLGFTNIAGSRFPATWAYDVVSDNVAEYENALYNGCPADIAALYWRS
jgi:hypothetical protein